MTAWYMAFFSWIETNPQTFGVIVSLFLGVLGYLTGLFKFLFGARKTARPTQSAGDGSVNIAGDNSGHVSVGLTPPKE